MNVGRLDGVVYRRADRGTTITVSNPTIQSSQVEVKIPDGYYLDNCGLVLPNSVLATALGIKATDIASGKSILGVVGTLTSGKKIYTGSTTTGGLNFPITLPISPGFTPTSGVVTLMGQYDNGWYGNINLGNSESTKFCSVGCAFVPGVNYVGYYNAMPAASVNMEVSSTNIVLSTSYSVKYVTGPMRFSWTLIS